MNTLALVDRIDRLTQRSLTAKAFREEVLSALRSSLPYDGHVFPLTDPVTRIATSPLADVPMLPWPRLPDMIRLRYLSVGNRWDRLSPAARLSARAIASPAFTDLLADLGVTDAITVVFADRHGCWGFLDLWRTEGTYADADVALLAAVAPSITKGLRMAVAGTFTEPDRVLVPIGPAVVLLGPALTVDAQTEVAGAMLLQLNPPDEAMAPVPAAAFNIGASLIAAEQGVPIGEPWSRLHLGGGRWVTARASRLGSNIAVAFEASTPQERIDLFGRVHGLSARETEVLALLATGLDSRELAARLVLSEHTVNDHVKAVLAKGGARTRQLLLARATGVTAAS